MDDDLYERLLRRGLARVADDIMRLTLPAIHLTCQRTEEALLLPGASKLGGLPNLPPETPWPEWRGAAMAFIAQIRLDEVAPYDLEGDLPHSGLLSFFYATDGEPKDNVDDNNSPETWKILHYDGDLTSLVRQPAPETLDEYMRFAACSMTYSRRLTLPEVEEVEESLGLTNQERLAYIDVELGMDLFKQFSDFPKRHQLLGYPYKLNSHPFVSSYLAAHHMTHHDVEAGGARWYSYLVQKVAREWRLLLQVDSNDEAGMDWAGGGVLHFCIPREALAARDFSRIWLEMQFL